MKTSIVVFERDGETEKVWFYEITGDGYSLDDKRIPQPEKNDIPDLLVKWDKKPVSDNSWFAAREEIIENDLNLTAGRYKPHVHEEVEYAKPKEIIAEVSGLEQGIAEGLNSLQKKL